MNDDPSTVLTMSLRGWAKHAGVAPSYAHKLIIEGWITRGADGRIPVAAADAALANLRAVASPGRLQANAARRAQRDPQRDRLREAAHQAAAHPLALNDTDGDFAAKVDAVLDALEMRIGAEQSRYFVAARSRLPVAARESATALEEALGAFETQLLEAMEALRHSNRELLIRIFTPREDD